MGAQDFVSFGYRSQSRETMEYSAKSECDGAFERRRETSTMEEFNKRMDQKMEEFNKKMDQRMDRILQAIGMWVNQNQPDADRSTTGGMLMNENQSSTAVRVKLEREEKAAVIIQAFLRTTLVRVKLERTIRLWGANAKNWLYAVRYATFDLGPWWKDYRGRQEEKARACAAAKARKRAKANGGSERRR